MSSHDDISKLIAENTRLKAESEGKTRRIKLLEEQSKLADEQSKQQSKLAERYAGELEQECQGLRVEMELAASTGTKAEMSVLQDQLSASQAKVTAITATFHDILTAQDQVQTAQDQVQTAQDKIRLAQDQARIAQDQARIAQDQIQAAQNQFQPAQDQVQIAQKRLLNAIQAIGNELDSKVASDKNPSREGLTSSVSVTNDDVSVNPPLDSSAGTPQGDDRPGPSQAPTSSASLGITKDTSSPPHKPSVGFTPIEDQRKPASGVQTGTTPAKSPANSSKQAETQLKNSSGPPVPSEGSIPAKSAAGGTKTVESQKIPISGPLRPPTGSTPTKFPVDTAPAPIIPSKRSHAEVVTPTRGTRPARRPRISVFDMPWVSHDSPAGFSTRKEAETKSRAQSEK